MEMEKKSDFGTRGMVVVGLEWEGGCSRK